VIFIILMDAKLVPYTPIISWLLFNYDMFMMFGLFYVL
jgi:hypothetical protein